MHVTIIISNNDSNVHIFNSYVMKSCWDTIFQAECTVLSFNKALSNMQHYSRLKDQFMTTSTERVSV